MPDLSNAAPLIAFGFGMIVLFWVILRLVLRRRGGRQRSPQRQVADAKTELDRWESRGQRGLKDAPPEVMRWQVEMHETARDLKGELDSKIALLAATVRQADSRIAELQHLIDATDNSQHRHHSHSLGKPQGLDPTANEARPTPSNPLATGRNQSDQTT